MNVRKRILLLIATYLTMLFCAVTVNAASSTTKNKATSAFKSFLKRFSYNSNSYKYFGTYDITRDGIKELIIGYGDEGGKFAVYQYKNGKLQLCGTDTTMFGLEIHNVKSGRYSYPSKCLQSSWIRHISAERWYYTISKGKLKKVYLAAYGSRWDGTYKYHSFKGKDISLSRYNKIVTEFNRGTSTFRLRRITSANIAAYGRA